MDTGSSIMLFFNEDLLDNISTLDDPMEIKAWGNYSG